MIIDNFDVFGIAVVKPENQPPRAIDRHRPLALAIAGQTMQTHRFQRRDVFNRPRYPQNLQTCHRLSDIHPAKLRLPVNREAFGRAVGEAHNHLLNMPFDTCHVKHVIRTKA